MESIREAFKKAHNARIDLSNNLRISPSIEEERIFAPIIQKYNGLIDLLNKQNMNLFDLTEIPLLNDIKTTICYKCGEYCFESKKICSGCEEPFHPSVCLNCFEKMDIKEQYTCKNSHE